MKQERKDWYAGEFVRINEEIGGKKCLSYQDFLRIKNYKAQALSIAEEMDIKKQTEKAFEAADNNDVEGAIKTLTKLHGVGIATASAILAMRNPDKYAIVDKRVIKNLGKSFEKNPLKSPAGYVEYLMIMKKNAAGKPLREYERKLFEKEPI
ncbi:hypothetical protein GF415_03070 [Candidatus Micrarchaeota archaeon]|nr:hypothetical protein [Candidatus Micrarchaeota archaeon]